MKEPCELEIARKAVIEELCRRENLLGWNSVNGYEPLVITLIEANHLLRSYVADAGPGKDPRLFPAMIKALTTTNEILAAKRICKCINKITFFNRKMIVRG